MSIKLIILFFIVIYLIFIGIISTIEIFKLINEWKRKNDIEENKVKNDLYRVYMDIDLSKTEEVIDNIIKGYINKWVLINITAEGDNYIKEPDVQELIKYVTEKFIIDMSDIHLFYLRCLTSITDDDSIIRYVRDKVKYLVLDFITDYNSL